MKLGFDVGGTGVQYKSDKGTGSFSTLGLNKDQVLVKMAEVIKETGATEVGIGSPGAINQKTGLVSGQTGIKGWGDFNIYNELRALVPVDNIQCVNDANAALLGELKLHKGVENAVMITVGTGIGGAVVINGKPMNGNNGYGGEFGYSLQIKEGEDQISGLVATTPLVKRVNAKMGSQKFANAREIVASSDPIAMDELDNWFHDLAKFVITKWFDFDPEVLLIAGGITKYKKFQETLESHILPLCKSHNFKYIPVIEIARSENPGIEGALALLGNEKNE